jgi:hypothetical protein
MQHKTPKVNLSLVILTLLSLWISSQQSRYHLFSSSSSAVQKAGTEQKQTAAIFRATGKGKRNNDVVTNIA